MMHDDDEMIEPTGTLSANEVLVLAAKTLFADLLAALPADQQRAAEQHFRAGGRFAVTVFLPSENVQVFALDDEGRPTTLASTGPLVNETAGHA